MGQHSDESSLSEFRLCFDMSYWIYPKILFFFLCSPLFEVLYSFLRVEEVFPGLCSTLRYAPNPSKALLRKC
jgi:hypothetical protein